MIKSTGFKTDWASMGKHSVFPVRTMPPASQSYVRYFLFLLCDLTLDKEQHMEGVGGSGNTELSENEKALG